MDPFRGVSLKAASGSSAQPVPETSAAREAAQVMRLEGSWAWLTRVR